MLSGKKGFLMPEVMLSVMIVSLTAVMLFNITVSHYTTMQVLRQEIRETDKETETALKGMVRCGEICDGKETPDS